MKTNNLESKLIKKISELNENYDGLYVTQKELDIIENSDMIYECEYVGKHEDNYTFHVKLNEDDYCRSLYVIED